MGALSIGYAQHRLGEGLACGSSSSLNNQLSLPPEERGGRDRDFFLHSRKKKKQSCLFFSGGGLIGFFCLFGNTGTEVLFFPYTDNTHGHTHRGSLAVLGPTTWGLISAGVLRFHSSPAGLTRIWLHRPSLWLPQSCPSLLLRLWEPLKGSPLDELQSGFCSSDHSRVNSGLPASVLPHVSTLGFQPLSCLMFLMNSFLAL